jgi:hypothetical protein
MDDDHDAYGDKVITMPRPKTPSLLDQLLNPLSTPDNKASASAAPATVPELPAQAPPKKSDPRPKPGDPYRAHALLLNRLAERELSISFVAKDCTPFGLEYSLLERVRFVRSLKAGTGLDLLLRFGGTEPLEVRIIGRNLQLVYDYIGNHTMPWVWERPDGRYAEHDAATVITAIIITNPATGEVLAGG